MAVIYKDIDLLSQKSAVAGTEKLPVSDTEYITPSQISSKVASDLDAGNIAYIGGQSGSAVSYTDPYRNAETMSYSDLKTLRTNSGLVPGKWYRITDYVATTSDTESRSASHPFDIIVVAETENALSEEGYAALHSGDSYFANNNLAAWKVWYCIDNDTTRFSWADSTNGKGVVYRLIDEFQNDLPFDFKGIQFKRYKIDDIDIKDNGVVNPAAAVYIGVYAGLSVAANKFESDSSDYKWFYPFTCLGSTWSADISDASLGTDCLSSQNTILPNQSSAGVKSLNNLVFARGEVLAGTVIDSTYVDAAVMHNCHFDQGATNLSIFGHSANIITRTQFRNSIILGHFRHNTISSDVQNNEFCSQEDFSFNEILDYVDGNTIIVGSGTVYGNRFTSYFIDNVAVCSDFSYNLFSGIFRRNSFFGTNFQGNILGVIYDSAFTGDFKFNFSAGYLRYDTFAYAVSCQFTGNIQYVTASAGTSSALFAGVTIRGPFSNSSGIKLESSSFLTGSSSATMDKAIVVESNDDGEVVATWKDTNGASTGVYATAAESRSNTWHNIASGGGGGSGTVTSVAMTVPTGLSVSGSPITSSGTLAVSLASGYEIPQTSAVVHKTGNESIAGTKTFADVNIDSSLNIASESDAIIQSDSVGFGWIKDDDGITLQSVLNAKQATLVSGTNIKTINNSSILGSGDLSVTADTSSCVHLTGDETIADDKTFTDNIAVVDADHILYSGGGGSGFTKGMAYKTTGSQSNSITFTGLAGEPKAFILVLSLYVGDTSSATAFGVVGDSTECHGVYTTGTQHNYSASFTKSYSSGSFTVTAPTGVNFMAAEFSLVYYYGDGTLTFHTKSMTPGSGVTSVTFTDTPLTEMPAMYAVMLESQVNNESYRRVGLFTDSWYDWDDTMDVLNAGWSFWSQSINNVTEYFTVSYNNGLVINSGGMNAGGYFHNPGTYTLYYLMASDIGGGGGGFQSLGDELDDIRDTIGDIATILAAI